MDDTIRLSLETLKINKQAIVFVASRSSAEKTAEDIAKLVSGNFPELNELSENISKVINPSTKQCNRLSKCISKGIAFHHAGLASKQKELIEEKFKDGTVKIICATPTLAAGLSLPVFRVIIKTLKRFSGKWGMDWIPVLEYLQMAGRAGRPEYEKFGEAIVIARDEKNGSEIHERYICGEAEDIYSKLAVEPVLRMYLLSLISSGVIKNEKEMREFFKETFWAAQFDDYQELGSIMNKMLNLLDEWGFVKKINLDEEVKNPYEELKQETTSDFLAANTLLKKIKNKIVKQDANIMLKPTLIGKRISQLYLDPLTAKHLIDCIKNVKEKSKEVKIGQFSYLQMVSNTIEMRPLPNVRVKEKELINQKLLENQDELLINGPDIYELDYPDFFKSIKTTLFFEEWINEKSENFLLDKYNVRPGEIRVKLENANWLLYASYELAEIIGERDIGKELRKLQTRVKYGVKEEIMPLLKFKGIGRSRARKLYNNGIKNITDIKKIDFVNLTQLIGEKLAINVKKQVGIEIKEVPKSKKTGQLSIDRFFS